MSDFQEGPDNFNFDSDPNNNKPQDPKKPSVGLDLLAGLGITVIAYILIGIVSMSGLVPFTIAALVDFIILGAFIFLNVKFFRTGHVAAASIMLVLILPCIFILLLLGACSLMFTGF